MARPQGSIADKTWRQAVVRAVKRRVDGKGSPTYLDALANRLVREGYDGNVIAIKEVGDRMDGKPVQGVEMALDVQITHVERRIVDPQAIEGVAQVVAVEAPEGAKAAQEQLNPQDTAGLLTVIPGEDDV